MPELSKLLKRRIYRKNHDQTYYNRVVKRMNCTLSNAEYGELCKQAETAGYKPTVYLKKASFAYMKQSFVVPVGIEAKLQQLVVIMRNIGRNVNEIAAKANKRNKATDVDLRKAEQLVFHMEDQIKLFIRNPRKDDAHLF